MRKSFTLLELLTVIIIIAILAAIAVPQFFKATERARASEGVHLLGIIRSAQLRYYAEHGVFTNSLDDLDVEIPSRKYFGLPTLNTPTYGDGTEQSLVDITRNNVECGSYCNYTLSISDDSGNVICTPGGAANQQCPPGFASSF